MKKIKSLLMLMATMIATFMFSAIVFAGEYQAPTAITGLKQTDAGSNSIGIAWDAQINCNYAIEVSTDGVNWLENGVSSTPDDSVSGLSVGQSYYVRVRGYRSEYTYIGDRTYGPYSQTFEVITRPDEVKTVSQTDATMDTATFTWDVVPGVTQYDVYKNVNGIETLAGSSATNSITLTGLSREEFSIEVRTVKKSASGFEAKSNYGKTLSSSDINLIPSRVGNVFVANYWGGLEEVNISWDKAMFADGYDVEVYKEGSKKAMTATKTTSDYLYVKNVNAKSFYKVRVRAYTTVNSIVKYGEWSTYTVFAQQPKVGLKRIGSKKLKLSWNKVKGATSYTVYVSTSQRGGYKKITTVKKNKNTYVLSKFKKKALKKNKRYYVYIVANKKIGKQTVKSYASDCFYLY